MNDGTIEGEVNSCQDCSFDPKIIKIDREVAQAEIAEMMELF